MHLPQEGQPGAGSVVQGKGGTTLQVDQPKYLVGPGGAGRMHRVIHPGPSHAESR